MVEISSSDIRLIVSDRSRFGYIQAYLSWTVPEDGMRQVAGFANVAELVRPTSPILTDSWMTDPPPLHDFSHSHAVVMATVRKALLGAARLSRSRS
jgi:hypothetical protein